MSVDKELEAEVEYTKAKIFNSGLSKDIKKAYTKLLTTSLKATNGLTPEKKIQQMTEAITQFAMVQGEFMVGIDSQIAKVMTIATTDKCKECKAMNYVNEVEEENHNKQLIEKLKNNNLQKQQQKQPTSWFELSKDVLTKPWIYVFGSIAFFSPYCSEILKTLISIFK